MPGGRKPKSRQIKELEGNRRKVGKDKIPEEPRAIGAPSVPMHLTAEERRLWACVVQSLPKGLLTRADDAMLERFVINWAMHREAHAKIRATSLMVQSPQGPVRNPLLVVLNQCGKEIGSAGAELGLSPAARARLASTDQPPDDDPFEQLLGGDPDGAWSTVPKHMRN